MRGLRGFLNFRNEKCVVLSGQAQASSLARPAFRECLLSSSIFPDGGESISLSFPVTDSTHIPWLLASSLHLHAMKHLFGLHLYTVF